MKYISNVTVTLVTKEAIIFILYLAASALVLNVFMQTRSLEEGSPAFGIEKMLDGSADRPYVYRQLVPITVNFLASLVPKEEHEAFVKYHLNRFHLRQTYFERAKYSNIYKGRESWTPTYSLKFHLVYIIMFASLAACAYCLRWLLNAVFDDSNPFYALMPILFLVLLPLSFVNGNFYYDFPELFFMSALLLAAIKGWYGAWIVLLPLAVLNKESNILIPLLYICVIVGDLGTWRNRIVIGLSVVLTSMVYLSVKLSYADNPGDTAVLNISRNLNFWLDPNSYFLWLDFYAPLIPFPRGINLAWIAVIVSTILLAWKDKPLVTKQLLVTAVLVNVPLLLFYGTDDEMRNLSFVFIPLYLVGSHSLCFLFNSSKATNISSYPT